MKKTLTFILSLLMVCTLIPVSNISAEEAVVYLDPTGARESSYTTLALAEAALPSEGGKIVVVSNAETTGDTTKSYTTVKALKIVGESKTIKFTINRNMILGADIEFDDIVVVNGYPSGNVDFIYAQGHNVTVGEDVTTEMSAANRYPSIFAGKASAACTANSTISISGGAWSLIELGNNTGKKEYSGNINCILKDCSVNKFSITGQTGTSSANVTVSVENSTITTYTRVCDHTGTLSATFKSGNVATITNTNPTVIDVSNNAELTLGSSVSVNSVVGGGTIKLGSGNTVTTQSLTGTVTLDIDTPVEDTVYFTCTDVASTGTVSLESESYELEKTVGDSSITWAVKEKVTPPQETIVYLDPAGTAGKETSYTTLVDAINALPAVGGKVVVCNDANTNPSTEVATYPTRDKVTIVGETKTVKLTLNNAFKLGGDLEIDNINFVNSKSSSACYIYCEGYDLTIGKDVTSTPYNSTTYAYIFTGGGIGEAVDVTGQVIDINGGTWGKVFCGGKAACAGSMTLNLTDTYIPSLNFAGSGSSGNTSADIEVNIENTQIDTFARNTSAGTHSGSYEVNLLSGNVAIKTLTDIVPNIDVSNSKTLSLSYPITADAIVGDGSINLTSNATVVANSMTGTISLAITNPVDKTAYLTVKDTASTATVSYSDTNFTLDKEVGTNSITWTANAIGEPPVVDNNIYLDPSGTTPNSYKTFAEAMTAVPEAGGTIVVCGDVATGTTSTAPTLPAKKIKIVGKTADVKLILGRSLTLKEDMEIDNIIFADGATASHAIFCNGFNLTIGEGVTTTPATDGTYVSILSGTAGGDTTANNQVVTIKGGTWANVFAGGYGTNGSVQKAFHGTVTYNIENATINDVVALGNRNGGTDDATVTMNIKDSTIGKLTNKGKGTYTGTYTINLSGANTINDIASVTPNIDNANGGTVTIGADAALVANTFAGALSVKITNPVHEQTYITINDKTATGTITYIANAREELEKVVGDANITYVMNNAIKTSVKVVYYNIDPEGTAPSLVVYKGYSGDTTKVKMTASSTGTDDYKNYAVYDLEAGLYYYEVYYNASNDYIKKYFYITGLETEQLVYDCGMETFQENNYQENVGSVPTDQILDKYFSFDYITDVDEEDTDTPNTPTFTNHADELRTFMTNEELVTYVNNLDTNCDNLKVYYPFGDSTMGNKTPVLVFTKDDISECATLAEAAAVVTAENKGTREILMINGGQHGNEPAGEEGALQFAYDLTGTYGDTTLDDIACIVIIPSISVDNNERFKRAYEDGCNSNRDILYLEHEGSQNFVAVYNLFMPTLFVSCHEDNAPLEMDSSSNTTKVGFHNLSFDCISAVNIPTTDVNAIANGTKTVFDSVQNQLANNIINKANAQGFYAEHYPVPSYYPVCERSYSAIRGSFTTLIEVTRINSFKSHYEYTVNQMTCALKDVVSEYIAYDKDVNNTKTLAELSEEARENAKVTEYDENNLFILKATAEAGGTDPYPIIHADGSVVNSTNTRTYKYYTTATATRSLPLAYVIPADLENIDDILALLDKHSIEYNELTAGTTKALKAYSISNGSAGASNCSVSLGVNKSVTFTNGAYEISLNQDDTYLIAYIFEPDSYSSTEALYASSLYKMGLMSIDDALYRYETDEIPTGDPCDVTFYVGSEVYETYEDVEYNALITAPENPEAAEKLFDGWYKEDTFEHKFNFATETITADTNLYAKFLACHTVSFYENSASGFVPGVIKTTDKGGWTVSGSTGLTTAQAFDKTNAKARVVGDYDDSDGKDSGTNPPGTGIFVTTTTGTVKKVVFEFDGKSYELTDATKLPAYATGSGNVYVGASGIGCAKTDALFNYVHNAGVQGFNLRFYKIPYDMAIKVYYEGSTVTFLNPDGSTLQTFEDVLYGAKLTSIPTAPEGDGNFRYWAAIDSDNTVIIDENTTITKDITVYPNYDGTQYNVTINHGTSANVITEKLETLLINGNDGNNSLSGKAYAGISNKGTANQNRYAQANGYETLDSISIKAGSTDLSIDCSVTSAVTRYLTKTQTGYELVTAAPSGNANLAKFAVNKAVTYIRFLNIDNDITVTFNYTEGAVSEIEAKAVLTSDKFEMDFKLDLPDNLNADQAYVMVDGVKHLLSEYETESGSIIVTATPKAVKEMSDEITMQVYASEGNTALTNPIKMTVKKYLVALINSGDSTEELKTFAKTMLNYGAYTQIYFDYNLDNLANEGVDNLPDISSVTGKTEDNYSNTGTAGEASFYGSSLLLGDTTNLYIYFTIGQDEDIELYTAHDNTDDKDLEIVADTNNPGLYYFTIGGIPAPKLSIKHEIVLKYNGVGDMTTTISPLSYAYLVIEKHPSLNAKLTNVMKAMYMYSDAAQEATK